MSLLIFLFFVWTHLFLVEGFRSLDFGADQWYQYLYLQITKIPWSKILRYNDFVNEKSEVGYKDDENTIVDETTAAYTVKGIADEGMSEDLFLLQRNVK